MCLLKTNLVTHLTHLPVAASIFTFDYNSGSLLTMCALYGLLPFKLTITPRVNTFVLSSQTCQATNLPTVKLTNFVSHTLPIFRHRQKRMWSSYTGFYVKFKLVLVVWQRKASLRQLKYYWTCDILSALNLNIGKISS